MKDISEGGDICYGTSMHVNPSEFSSYIGTNYVPTDNQILQISSLLSEPLATLKALEEERERIWSVYEEVSKKHDALSKEIDDYRALISTIRRLPDDILEEVFFRCLPTEHNAVMSNNHPPLLLTRICRHWRGIALSTPRLWASIHIPVPARSRYYAGDRSNYDDTVIELVIKRAVGAREWLARSGACPLSISLNDWDAGPNTHCEALIGSFIEFSSRWKELDISASLNSLGLIAATADVPLLESLTIDCGRGKVPGPDAPSFTWAESSLLNAPNLRNVFLRQIPEDPTQLPLKWSRLTVLSLRGIYWGGAILTPFKIAQTLKQCVQLVTCHLEIPAIYPRSPDDQADQHIQPSAVVSLPFLKHLSIHDVGGGDIASFLEMLDTPSLYEFEYKSLSRSHMPDTTSPLLPFLSRTSATVRKFITDTISFSEAAFLQCLLHCPLLKSLCISGYDIGHPGWGGSEQQDYVLDDEFLRLLTSPDEDGNYLCPDLEELECCCRAGFSDAAMLEFITRKQDGSVPAVAKLKRMDVSFDREKDMPIDLQTEQFVEDGLEFGLHYSGPFFARGPLSAFDGLSDAFTGRYHGQFFGY